MTEKQHFVFALIENFSHIAFSCAVEPLRIANLVSGEELYSWSMVSENGEDVTCSGGTTFKVQSSFENLGTASQVFVVGGIGVQKHMSPAFKAMIRKSRLNGYKIGALCSGSWLLAEMGFLDGQKAAIHWEFHDAFAEKFPNVELVESVFSTEGKYITASGGTATADLMLHLIEESHGSEIASAVADQLVYTSAREATGKQRSSLQSKKGIRNQHLAKTIQLMNETVENPIQASELASKVGVSSRQIERLFSKHLNTTPNRYYRELRLERARRLLIHTESSIIEIAIACGFETSGHFSAAYRNTYGISPTSQRNKYA